MVIKDLSGLPNPEKSEGSPPVADPKFVSAIAHEWYKQYLDKQEHMRSKAIEGLPFRASHTAFRCDRQLFYAMRGDERPLPELADAYRMSLGTLVHSGLEPAIHAVFDDAQFEVQVDLRSIGVPGSAHADIVTYHTDGRANTVVEVKTVNGFGFKSMATDFKGAPAGPRSGHILQAALSAMALDADEVVIAYLSMESVSPALARYTTSDVGRFAAEWRYTRDEYQAIARPEIARIQRLVDQLENFPDVVPAPFIWEGDIPDGAFIQDPARGMWVVASPDDANVVVDTGKVWFCDYCDWREQCLKDNIAKETAVNIGRK